MRCFDSCFKADCFLAAVGADGVECAVVRTEDWRKWFYREGKPGEAQETKQKAFKRAVEGLLAKGKISADGDLLWLSAARV